MQGRFSIIAPSYLACLVTRDGKQVDNWRDLETQAREAIAPEFMERHTQYWLQVLTRAEAAIQDGAGTKAIMDYPISPAMHYDCPEWLANLAVVNVANNV